MKKLTLTFVFVFAMLFAMYLPAQAKDVKQPVSFGKTTMTVNYSAGVRYVRVRGKRYKVWYKIYYKNGRRYIRILRYQRA